MTSKSLTASVIATWKKRAGTTLTRIVFLPLISIVHAVWLVGVLCVLLPWLSLDFLPKRRSKQLTSQPPNRRKLPILLHERGTFFAINPDGQKVEIEPLLFAAHFQDCAKALAASMVYEKTKIKLDESG